MSARVYGGYGRAAARLSTIRNDIYLLTAVPDAYGGDADGIIAVD